MSSAQAESPAVSVVIAAYNAERTLSETLKSIGAQTFRDFEVIVVDDGSTDGTSEVVGEIAAGAGAASPRMICQRQPNRGPAAARNRGFDAARGRYLAFVDADDLWMPEKLEKQVGYLDAHPEDGMVYSDAEVFDGESGKTLCRVSDKCRLYEGNVLERLFLTCFIPSATPMVRRAVFEAAGLFDESRELEMAEDWAMWLRIASCWRVGLVREPLAKYRIHGASITHSSNADALYESKRKVVEQAVARNPALEGMKSRVLGDIAISAGLRHLKRGDLQAARRMFAEAIHERPWDALCYLYIASAYLPGELLLAMTRCREAS
jgi:glycosyltransferase involved in cell wall biosynthesis